MPPSKPDPKQTALAAQGTLNPSAAEVRDPSFIDGEFFDPRDLVQVKYEMLRRVRSEGHAIAEVTESFGLSRPTFYKAQSDFARDGLAGLLPSKRGPRGPHKLTAKVMAFVDRILAKEPEVDAAVIAERVERELDVHVHPRSIERALAKKKRS
jgi:transposase